MPGSLRSFLPCLIAAGALSTIEPAPASAEAMEIDAIPVLQLKPGTSRSKFGKLEFIGGLELTSTHEEFGGLSAIRFSAPDRLVLITDKARVITAEMAREDGRPLGLAKAAITRIRAENGRTITGANDKDAEALEIAGESFFVGYERNDRVMRFSMRNRTLVADGNYLVDFNPLAFPNNQGPEAIALHPETGELFVFAEHAISETGHHRGFVVSGGSILRELGVRYTDRYSLTDAAFLANGDLMLLERYYNPFTGVFMRIRKIAADRLEREDPLDGEVLIELGPETRIDNMEGMAVTHLQDGAYRITLVSDDNFSASQRTLLLEFRLEN